MGHRGITPQFGGGTDVINGGYCRVPLEYDIPNMHDFPPAVNIAGYVLFEGLCGTVNRRKAKSKPRSASEKAA